MYIRDRSAPTIVLAETPRQYVYQTGLLRQSDVLKHRGNMSIRDRSAQTIVFAETPR